MEKKELAAYSELISRIAYARALGMQYNGQRDVYTVLGYPKDLTFTDFYTHYKRQDIASAVIDRPINTMWRGNVLLSEKSEKDITELETKWKEIWETLKLKSKLIRLDKLASIGKFSVLLLGFDDVSETAQYSQPVNKNVRLLYVQPYGEQAVKIKKYYDDPKNDKYSTPELYEITIMQGSAAQQIIVHESRVLHIAYDILESEWEGTPALQKVYNRLMDLEKIVGGGAEMFWRGARPGYQGKVDKDYTMTPEMEKDLKNKITEFEHDLRRIIVNEGVDLEALAQQVSDPSKHVDVQVSLISAKTGIPKRILMGSERGELASSQDKDAWYGLVTERRSEIGEAMILTPLVKRLQGYGVLPETENEWEWKWSDLYAVSEKDKAEVGKLRSEALSKYASSAMATDIIPPESYMKYILGLSESIIEKIMNEVSTNINEEQGV